MEILRHNENIWQNKLRDDRLKIAIEAKGNNNIRNFISDLQKHLLWLTFLGTTRLKIKFESCFDPENARLNELQTAMVLPTGRNQKTDD